MLIRITYDYKPEILTCSSTEMSLHRSGCGSPRQLDLFAVLGRFTGIIRGHHRTILRVDSADALQHGFILIMVNFMFLITTCKIEQKLICNVLKFVGYSLTGAVWRQKTIIHQLFVIKLILIYSEKELVFGSGFLRNCRIKMANTF